MLSPSVNQFENIILYLPQYRFFKDPILYVFKKQGIQFQQKQIESLSPHVVINDKTISDYSEILNYFSNEIDENYSLNILDLMNKTLKQKVENLENFNTILYQKKKNDDISGWDILFYLIIKYQSFNKIISYDCQQFMLQIENSIYEFLKNKELFLNPFFPDDNLNFKAIYNHLNLQKDQYNYFAAIENCLIFADSQQTQTVSLSLLPKIIDKSVFQSLSDSQFIWHKLINQIMQDQVFFQQTFDNIQDPFVQRLYKIYQKSNNYSFTQTQEFLVIRNDYMYSTINQLYQQIEINLFSVGLVSLSEKAYNFHKKIFKSIKQISPYFQQFEFLENNNIDTFLQSFLKAYELYNQKGSKILFVVEEKEWNMYDQMIIQQKLFENNIDVIRKTINNIKAETDNLGRLWIDGYEIAVVYWRWGYSPDHYQNEFIWNLKEIIECSRSIKCPSIKGMLINLKEIQLQLQNPEIIKKYLNEQEIKVLNQQFAKIWRQNDPQAQQLALQNPNNYVLKPQREGGGNNFFGKDLINNIYKNLQDYQLMEKIDGLKEISFQLTNSELKCFLSQSELGIFSFLILDKEIKFQKVSGYLLRTKNDDYFECGVSKGAGMIDSHIYKS